MKIYRVHIMNGNKENKGYEYFASMRQAAKSYRGKGEPYRAQIQQIEVAINKAGILRALNLYASHPHNE